MTIYLQVKTPTKTVDVRSLIRMMITLSFKFIWTLHSILDRIVDIAENFCLPGFQMPGTSHYRPWRGGLTALPPAFNGPRHPLPQALPPGNLLAGDDVYASERRSMVWKYQRVLKNYHIYIHIYLTMMHDYVLCVINVVEPQCWVVEGSYQCYRCFEACDS